MQLFDKFNLQEIISNINSYQLSFSYDNYDNVQEIHINNHIAYYDVSAIVNVLGEEYEVAFLYDYKYHFISYGCDCIWCDENSPCAHIGAVLLKLNDLEIDEYPFHYIKSDSAFEETKYMDKELRQQQAAKRRYRERLFQLSVQSEKMIESEKRSYENELSFMISQEQYDLHPKLCFKGREIHLEYKIGNDHTYIIKNIGNFLDSIEQKEYIKYGKFLAFTHNEQAFTDFARRQLEFINKSFYDYNEPMMDKYFYNEFGFDLRRELLISTLNIDDFYDLYKDYDLDNAYLCEINGQIEAEIIEEDEYYIIRLNECYFYGQNYLYNVSDESTLVIVERLLLDQDYKCCKLVKSFYEEELVIPKAKFEEFYKYVLYPVKDYFHIKHLNEHKENEYEYENIKIYGDIEDDNKIVFKIYYINENQDKILAFQNGFTTNYSQDLVEKYFQSIGTVDRETHLVYLDIDSQKTYEFMREGLDFLKQYAEIYVTDALRKIGRSVNYSLSVGVKIENDLLELDIESIDIPKIEIAKVLEQYKQKKKFYRLKNGELLYLESPELEELSSLIDNYHLQPRDIKNGMIKLHKNRAFSIENDANQYEHIQMNRKQSFTKLIDQFDKNLHHTYSITPHYQNILRDYQKDGLQWLKTLHYYGFNGILADDMGLGKTLQIIALIDEIAADKTSIVICPSSLIYNWEDEVNKFAPHLKAKCIEGNADKRKHEILTYNQYQLLITSYDYMRRDFECYEEIDFEYIILDESQYIKNQKTKNAQSVKLLNGKHRLALSGTPIENSLAELWSVFDFLMPQYLFNYHYFQKHYETEIIKNNNEEVAEKLKKLVTPFILRRNKKDVLSELPDKIEVTQLIPFTQQESEIYFANLAQVNSELQGLFKEKVVDKIQILAMLTKLRQICCEPRMLYENIETASSKLKASLELINNYKQNNQKVLLFSSFTKVFDLLEDEFRLNGISYFKITGSTTKENRKEYVKRFQEGGADVFLISLKAGGTGLNLTRAEAVIHFDPWWNVSAQNQATDRAYRIGQYKNVQVHKLIMKDSIEEKILTLQEKKKQLSDMLVENNQGNITSLSKEEILELFAYE